MAYPRIEKYNEAFQNHQSFILDAELKSGKLARNGLGLPKVISGGFALTYVIETSSKKYAVRCFHKEASDLELRYNKISEKINSLHSDYFVNFEFLQEGIIVSGSRYPLVKMEWAKGETLGEFVETNYRNSLQLKNLSNSIINLAQYIENNDIAHGDIQPGNLMVSNNGKTLKLIDYDGMYTDSLKSVGSAELGHINFQHPQRKDINPFNSKLDRFSFIELWLAISALIEDSNIWTKTKSDMDSFVFTANDYHDPQKSATFNLLSGYPALKDYVESFGYICEMTVTDVPSLHQFANEATGQLVIPTTGSITTSSLSSGHYFSQYPVLEAMSFADCFKHIGDQVEVVGKIIEVRKAYTKGKKPYVFINFGDWRGKIFKIAIWSEGLDVIDSIPDKSWEGKYVSIKGLMEPPYSSGSYTHLAITLSKNNQLSLITQDDYIRRLNAKKSSEQKVYRVPEPKLTAPLIPDNSKILEGIRGRTTTSNKNIGKKPTVNNQGSKNRDLLKDIKQANSVSLATPKPVPKPVPKPIYSSDKNSPKMSGEDLFNTIVFVIVVLIILKACS